MNKTLIAILLVLVGLIMWTLVIYAGLAFITSVANPFIWSKGTRFLMVFFVFIYLLAIPILFLEIKDDL